MSSPADLIALSDLLNFANVQNPTLSVNAIAQQIIDGLSQAIYWATGRTVPMFTDLVEFTETYNGSGSGVLYLMNAPIMSVDSVTANGIAIPVSEEYGQAGYFIQQDGKSIALRSGGTTGYPFVGSLRGNGLNYCFPAGRGNVVVDYTAGYLDCPPDLYLLVLKWGTFFLNKRLREDEASHMIPGSGQTNYRSWAMQPEVRLLLAPYTRTAMANFP